MGSLDDTVVARFDLARAAAAAEAGATPPAPPLPDGVEAEALGPAGAAPDPALQVQRFAVQLAWSTTPIDLARVARPPVFGGHVLYRVQSERDGRRWYGLRLGFFRDHLSARLVLQHARRDFALAAVVPVSDREYARVTGAEAPRRA
jgi:hypothetical protein